MTPAPRTETQIVRLWLPGKLRNPLNGAHGHWAVAARERKRWRQFTNVMARAECTVQGIARTVDWARRPKVVTLHAQTWNTMDDDGLRAALKGVVDGLIDAGILHSDAPDSGHRILYTQERNRMRRGVSARVEMR